MFELIFELFWHIYHLTTQCQYIPLWGIIPAESSFLDPFIGQCIP